MVNGEGWYKSGTRKSGPDGSARSMFQMIPDQDIPDLFTPGGKGFETRVTALLNHCGPSYQSWCKFHGYNTQDRDVAAMFLLSDE